MDPTIVEALRRLITETGFPVVVGLWLLYRTDNIIRAHTQAIQELTIAIKEWRASKG